MKSKPRKRVAYGVFTKGGRLTAVRLRKDAARTLARTTLQAQSVRKVMVTW